MYFHLFRRQTCYSDPDCILRVHVHGWGGKGGHHVDLVEGKPSHLSLLLLVYSSTLPTRIPFCIEGGSLAEACFPSPNRRYQTRVVPGFLAVQSQTLQIPRWLVGSLFNQTPSWHECTKQVFFFSVCLGGFFWFFFALLFFVLVHWGGPMASQSRYHI